LDELSLLDRFVKSLLVALAVQGLVGVDFKRKNSHL